MLRDSPKGGAVTPEEIVAFVEGLAAAIASGRPGALAERLDGTEPKAVEHALRLAAAAIAHQSAGSRNGSRHGFWERLASGFSDDASAREEAAAAGIELAPAYLAITLEIDGDPSDVPRGAADLRSIALDVFGAGAEIGVLERAGIVDLLIPVAREVDASNARTAATLLPKTLAKRQAAPRVSGGIGGAGPAIETPHNLRRAQAALAIGRRIFGHGRVCVYDDLGAYALLYSGASVEELRGFARNTLEPVRAYDEKHQTELERTLRVYFALGQNVKTAAAELNVHRHTVFYRLRQIAEICRCDLGAPHDQLTLRLAMAIYALHS